MSMQFTNRVYLPNGEKIYLSDDKAGDHRAMLLYQRYGNLKLEACEKVHGKSLDELKPFWTGTIEGQYS